MTGRGENESAEGAESAGSGRGQSRRIESALGAAEQAAAGIREEAEEWARSLAESRERAEEEAAARIRETSQLTDSLVVRARALAQQSDELAAALDEVKVALGVGDGAGDDLPKRGRSALGPGARKATSSEAAPEGARLLATQMAVAGRPRDEISGQLRKEFGIQDPAGILDEIGI